MLLSEEQQLNWIYELYKMGQSDSLQNNSNQVFELILRHVVKGFSADSGSLALYQGEDSTCLRIVAGIGLPQECIGNVISNSSGVIGWIIEHKQALLLKGSVNNDPRFHDQILKPDSKTPTTALCWPLLKGEQISGVLCINRFDERQNYTKADLNRGKLLVKLITQVIVNIRLHSDQHKHIQQLTDISNSNDKQTEILFVDDEVNVLKALRRLFRNEPYVAYFASNGAEALEILHKNAIDLIISDMRMPHMNGAELLDQVAMQWPEIISILLTGYADFKSTIDAINNGHIYYYCNKPWDDDELKLLIHNALELKRVRQERYRLSDIVCQQNIELKELNDQLEEKVELRTTQLKNAMLHLDLANNNLKEQYIDSIKVFSRIIEMRPGIKNGQSIYIAEKALLVANKLGMSHDEKKNICYAGLLLQIGKMTFTDNMLAKSYFSMSDINKRQYLQHAVEGENLLKGLSLLKDASIIIRHQYECYDGSGFPDGLAKQKIPLGSRIINVISDYIAYCDGSMTGEVMNIDAVINVLVSRKNSYYDPDVVNAFIKVLQVKNVENEELGQIGEQPKNIKLWRNAILLNETQNNVIERPVLRVSWTHMKPGMEIESIYFGNKPYLINCTLDQQIIDRILLLRENGHKDPVIKIHLGKK